MSSITEIARDNLAAMSVGFGPDGARGKTSFAVTAVDHTELRAVITTLMGDLDFSVTPVVHRLTRILPMRHPYFYNLFINAITNFQGVGKQVPTTSRADPVTLNRPIWGAQYPHYSAYQVDVDVMPRSYSVLPDSSITTTTSSYYNANGAATSYTYATEWMRYVTWAERSAEPQLLTSKFGQMYFKTQDNAAPGNADVKSAAHVQAAPYQVMPDSVIAMRWYQVPLRFITSKWSYLRNCPVGVINQFDWFDPFPGADKMFPKASLRYGGASIVREYDPPTTRAAAVLLGIPIGLETNKLCDIEMIFYRTTRDRFRANVPTAAQSNLNWIPRGWNLQPWLTTPNKYYFFHTAKKGDENNAVFHAPPHNSFPFELFFTDPDGVQPNRPQMIEVNPDT